MQCLHSYKVYINKLVLDSIILDMFSNKKKITYAFCINIESNSYGRHHKTGKYLHLDKKKREREM